MKLPLREIAHYTQNAPTEELLDRVTVYREGMEPAALDLMEGELDRRGVTRAQIAAHDAETRASAIMLPDGTAKRCSRCDRPAVVESRGWHRWKARLPFVSLGLSLPLIPMRFAYCAFHNPDKPANPEPPAES
ncbi:MAG: hypothetical protein K2V38_08490 [Gemmataceae bacterium]|nr:hypothetical protein [Gemmataceae bacterium]